MVRAVEDTQSSIASGLRQDAIPRAPERLAIEKRWCLTDSKKAYRRRRHSLLNKTSINYALNSLGYRCRDFESQIINDPDHFQLVVLGGSETFGVGLPEDRLYINLLASRLAELTGKMVNAWNLALPMAGSSYIARMLNPVLTVLSPDFLFLNFPELAGYREYFNDDDEVLFCEPGALPHRRKISRFWDPEAARMDRAHLTLASDFNDTANFYNNYYYCEFLCEHHRVNWLYSAPYHGNDALGANSFSEHRRVASVINQVTQECDATEELLLARDFIHPGILPHRLFSDAVFERYLTQYGSGAG